jgi:hypothetical protein
MTTSLGQNIKQQIMVVLNTLKTNGVINSYVSQDQSPNAITQDPPSGYPFAIVGMPRIANDMEENATNLRTYRFDILFVCGYEGLTDVTNSIEGIMDAVLNTFDTNFTLGGSAVGATVPPAHIEPLPLTIADKTYVTFVVSIEARGLYTLGT